MAATCIRSRLVLLAAQVMICAQACAERPAIAVGQDELQIPVTDAAGTHLLRARLCRPPSANGPARLVVISHGSPPSPAARPRMQLTPCDAEAAQWFLSRGYAVLSALRRGYGATGGDWVEGFGSCAEADFARGGLETARDIAAVVEYGTALPGIRPDHVTLVGQSAGGWGTIASDSLPHPKVAAFVVMAGGRGGHEDNRPGKNCHPEKLAAAAGQFGRTASTPMLWIYAANDSFFAPAIAEAMHAAFTQAGGQAVLDQPAAFGSDGHQLFFGPGGSAIWGPLVEPYLDRRLSD